MTTPPLNSDPRKKEIMVSDIMDTLHMRNVLFYGLVNANNTSNYIHIGTSF